MIEPTLSVVFQGNYQLSKEKKGCSAVIWKPDTFKISIELGISLYSYPYFN
jgi:hypothetical protein